MAITIVTTVSGTTSNSYVTLAQANTYMEAVPWFDSTWDALTDAQKNSYLVQATRALDRMRYRGARYDKDQALEFPRTITDDSTDEGEMPQKVKDAQCELIIWHKTHLDSTTGEPDRRVQKVGLGRGAVDVEFTENLSPENNLAGGMPESVRALLATWLISGYNLELLRG